VAWAALLLVLTSIPNPPVPRTLAGTDKVVHALLYGVLAWLAVLALGWADEWHQQFIPGRSQDAADWLADGTGAALAILTASARSRREQPT